jgi:hypothetical protein
VIDVSINSTSPKRSDVFKAGLIYVRIKVMFPLIPLLRREATDEVVNLDTFFLGEDSVSINSTSPKRSDVTETNVDEDTVIQFSFSFH